MMIDAKAYDLIIAERNEARAECARLRGYHRTETCRALDEVREEIVRARIKFPSNDLLFKALVEEVGELGKALMGHGGDAREEAKHVACVAVRIMVEGEGKG